MLRYWIRWKAGLTTRWSYGGRPLAPDEETVRKAGTLLSWKRMETGEAAYPMRPPLPFFGWKVAELFRMVPGRRSIDRMDRIGFFE